MKSIPFVIGQFKVLEHAVLRHHGGQRHHARDDGHTLAVRAGIRRLVVNSASDYFQKSFQHVFLRRQQQLVVNRDGGVGSQRFDQSLH